MKSQRALNLRTIFLAVLVVVTSCSKETKEETNVSAPVKTSHSKVSEAMNIETEMQSDAELEKLDYHAHCRLLLERLEDTRVYWHSLRHVGLYDHDYVQ